MADPRVWLLIAVYFTVALADNAFGFYLPKSSSTASPAWSPSGSACWRRCPSVAAIVGMIAFGVQFGSHRRAALARRRGGLPGGRRLGAGRPRLIAVAGPCRPGAGQPRHEEHVADVLDAAHVVPERGRGRGRHRPHQLGGEPRRRGRTQRHGPGAGPHRRLRGRLACSWPWRSAWAAAWFFWCATTPPRKRPRRRSENLRPKSRAEHSCEGRDGPVG